MQFSLDDILEGVEYVSSDPDGEAEALLSLASGEIYYRSNGLDEVAHPLPEDIDDDGKYLSLPHKNDLDLGPDLVIAFVGKRLPQDEMAVRAMFKKRGAYASFKHWARQHGVLDDWYAFEGKATRAAVAEWCQEQGVPLAAD